MSTPKPYPDNLPTLGECDVLVCGGGPAGFVAAVAAARNGAKTILLERYGFFGGMASAGMVHPIYGYFARHLQIITGIPQELIDRLKKIPGGTGDHTYRHDCVARRDKQGECVTGKSELGCPVASVAQVVPVDGEAVKLVALEMIEEAGVSWHLHTQVVALEREGSRITGVIVHGKSGFGIYRGRVVIDATGDADVAALADVPFHSGNEDDGAMKPPTLMFRIGGVRLSKDRIWAAWPPDQSTGAGGDGCWLMAMPRPGEYAVNSPTGIQGFDATKTEHVSQAQALATKQVWRKLELIRKHVDGCQDAVLLSIAPQLGLRDSRRIEGDYLLTEDDVLKSVKFPDGITNGVHPIDLHMKSERFQGRHTVLTPCGDYYQIPYRCMLPKGADNLLVAGRSISATFMAQGSLRVMATCMGMGQAAGTAAALCVPRGLSPRDIKPDELRALLKDQGAYLGHEHELIPWNQGGAPAAGNRVMSVRGRSEA